MFEHMLVTFWHDDTFDLVALSQSRLLIGGKRLILLGAFIIEIEDPGGGPDPTAEPNLTRFFGHERNGGLHVIENASLTVVSIDTASQANSNILFLRFRQWDLNAVDDQKNELVDGIPADVVLASVDWAMFTDDYNTQEYTDRLDRAKAKSLTLFGTTPPVLAGTY